MTNTTQTIKAIPLSDGNAFLVLAGHAGHLHSTGTKVHVSWAHYNLRGELVLDSTWCSSNGSLRGSNLITGADFSAVTCKKCCADADNATYRNSKAIDIPTRRNVNVEVGR